MRRLPRLLAAVERFLREAGDPDRQESVGAAAAIAAQRRVRVFGSSHAGLLAQDLVYRAGGLAPVDAVLPAELMLNVRPITRTSDLERQPGLGRQIFEQIAPDPGDVLILISVSGRNPATVEAAEIAQERGATVVALTSLAYSREVSARGSQRLFETPDIVIDLPGVAGDACVPIGGAGITAGPTSSAIGTAILHGLCVEVAELLAARGIAPPVYRSANLDAGDAVNRQLFREYAGRVDHLG